MAVRIPIDKEEFRRFGKEREYSKNIVERTLNCIRQIRGLNEKINPNYPEAVSTLDAYILYCLEKFEAFPQIRRGFGKEGARLVRDYLLSQNLPNAYYVFL